YPRVLHERPQAGRGRQIARGGGVDIAQERDGRNLRLVDHEMLGQVDVVQGRRGTLDDDGPQTVTGTEKMREVVDDLEIDVVVDGAVEIVDHDERRLGDTTQDLAGEVTDVLVRTARPGDDLVEVVIIDPSAGVQLGDHAHPE